MNEKQHCIDLAYQDLSYELAVLLLNFIYYSYEMPAASTSLWVRLGCVSSTISLWIHSLWGTLLSENMATCCYKFSFVLSIFLLVVNAQTNEDSIMVCRSTPKSQAPFSIPIGKPGKKGPAGQKGEPGKNAFAGDYISMSTIIWIRERQL